MGFDHRVRVPGEEDAELLLVWCLGLWGLFLPMGVRNCTAYFVDRGKAYIENSERQS